MNATKQYAVHFYINNNLAVTGDKWWSIFLSFFQFLLFGFAQQYTPGRLKALEKLISTNHECYLLRNI